MATSRFCSANLKKPKIPIDRRLIPLLQYTNTQTQSARKLFHHFINWYKFDHTLIIDPQRCYPANKVNLPPASIQKFFGIILHYNIPLETVHNYIISLDLNIEPHTKPQTELQYLKGKRKNHDR